MRNTNSMFKYLIDGFFPKANIRENSTMVGILPGDKDDINTDILKSETLIMPRCSPRVFAFVNLKTLDQSCNVFIFYSRWQNWGTKQQSPMEGYTEIANDKFRKLISIANIYWEFLKFDSSKCFIHFNLFTIIQWCKSCWHYCSIKRKTNLEKLSLLYKVVELASKRRS